jgi:hypothetical protein
MIPTKLILVFTAILVILFCVILWLADYSSFDIPEYIGTTRYQTYTVAMGVTIILVLILFQKLLVKKHPDTKAGKLILWSVLVCLFSQGVYQVFRQVWILRNENNDKASDYFVSLASSTILSLFIASSIAFELKKSNTILKTLAAIAVFGLLFVLRKYFPNTTW